MGDLVLTREEVREIDRLAIEEWGIPSIVLMENAGRACAFEVLELRRRGAGAPPAPVVVMCGPGNNGGDGFVVARTLLNHGVACRVFFAGESGRLARASSDLRTNANAWRRMGGATDDLVSGPESALTEALRRAPVVVDALVGTGLSAPLRPAARALVEALAQADRPVVAVDLPSGLDADSGEILGAVAPATTTVTFVARKPGFDRGHGPAVCGRVIVAEIGIPRPLLEQAARRAE